VALAHALSEATPGPQRVDRRRRMAYLLLLPGMAWLAVFFVVPLITLFLTALQTRVPGGLTGQYEQTFRFMNFVDVLSRPQFLESLWRSFLYASSATVIALLIGYPLAYTIALKAGRWKAVMLVMVIAPFFVSFILRTIAWRQILTDEGPVVGFLNALGVPIGSIYPSAIAVVAGLAYNFLPFMTLPIFASLERLDVRLVEAAGDLYSSPFTAFRKVTLPLSMPGVVAGTLLTFIPAAGDYINATLLGNQRTTMLGNVIDSRFLNVVDYPTAAVLSFTLMAFILTLVFFYVRRIGSEELV
jgi:spermidine/putrescine transport system permease protein